MHLVFIFKQARPRNDHCKKGLYTSFLHSDKPQINPFPSLQFLSSISIIRKSEANDCSEFLNQLFLIVRTCICSHILLLNTKTEQHFLKQVLQSIVLLISASKMDISKTWEMVFLRWDLQNYYWMDGIDIYFSKAINCIPCFQLHAPIHNIIYLTNKL